MDISEINAMASARTRYEEIPEFPMYYVGEDGTVANMAKGGSIINARPNQYGHIRVGLMKDGKQYNRGLSAIVAAAFVEQERPTFNTVIHLDGDLYNCAASNLKWRPRWFAIAYHKQWRREIMHTTNLPIECVQTGEKFDSPRDAVKAHGILFGDIVLSFTNDHYTFPTMQQWRPVQ